MLEDSIPASFSNLSLSGFDLLNNQLSESIPQQGSLIIYPKNLRIILVFVGYHCHLVAVGPHQW
jgi:hypothetical protein